MKRLLSALTLLLLALAVAASAWAAPSESITLISKAEIEKQVATPEGRLETQRLPAEKVLPGEVVIFTNLYTNAGDQGAEKVVITNPVPEHMSYVADSAFGEGAAVTFSVDGGQTFDRPENLKVKDAEGKERPAQSADYTHIRWTLQHTIPAKGQGEVGFRAQLD